MKKSIFIALAFLGLSSATFAQTEMLSTTNIKKVLIVDDMDTHQRMYAEFDPSFTLGEEVQYELKHRLHATNDHSYGDVAKIITIAISHVEYATDIISTTPASTVFQEGKFLGAGHGVVVDYSGNLIKSTGPRGMIVGAGSVAF